MVQYIFWAMGTNYFVLINKVVGGFLAHSYFNQILVAKSISSAAAIINTALTNSAASNAENIKLRVSFLSRGGCSWSLVWERFGVYHGIPSTFIGAITLPSSSKVSIFFFLFCFFIYGIHRIPHNFLVVKVAGYKMPLLRLYCAWRNLGADIHTLLASGMELAARWRICG